MTNYISSHSESKFSIIRVKRSKDIESIILFSLIAIVYHGAYRKTYAPLITDNHFIANQHIINHLIWED